MNAIELEVMRHLFASIAEEMGVALMRSAFSPNIKERRDYSCALFDARGEMVAQAAHIPVHLGSTPMSVLAALRAFPDGIPAGEHVLLNDPYEGGTHLPDLTLVSAVYDDVGELCFYVANRAHHADVGGISAGSLPLSTHIDEEGFRTGPRLLTPQLEQELYHASRTPDERRGDLLAQIAANHRGVQRLKAQLVKRGPALLHAAAALQDYSERMMRVQIARMPDGTWSYQDMLESDGQGARDIIISADMSIRGDEMTFDFTASQDQVTGPLNVPGAVTASAVLYGMCCLLPESVPSNGGMMRPLKLVTRPGSVVDAVYPAAVAAGNVETSQRITDVVFGLLAQVLPERVPAGSCGTMNNVLIGGDDPRINQPYAYYETIGGGSGASAAGEGASGVQTHMTNTLNTPVEALEHAYPFMVVCYALRQSSGGQGVHSGGQGVERTYRFLGDAEVTLMTERRARGAAGAQGGRRGGVGINRIKRTSGSWETLPSKITLQVHHGDEISLQTPGGGGWGSPRQVD